MKIMLRGVRLGLRIGRSSPLVEYLDLPSPGDYPPKKEGDLWLGTVDPDRVTDEDIEWWIREKSETLYHPVSTARMGQDPSKSVVDTDLKVHGVDGLRVVDASIFPEQLSGHPTATLIAIGEVISDRILRGAK